MSRLLPTVAALLAAVLPLTAQEIPMYVGTYTKPNASKGVYLYGYDPATGKVTEKGLAVESSSPSFLVRHPNKKFVYAVNEADGGSVSAFAVEADGKLRELNRQPSLGKGPTHLAIDRDGKNVLVANYGGGSVACFPVNEDGTLKPAAGFVQHKGKGTNPKRQEGPHAHSVYVDSANTHVYAADLGLDQIFVYRFNPADGSLNPADPPSAATAPGAGPRHLAFSPGDKFIYVCNEMSSTVTGFAKESGRAVLKEIQTISTLPADFTAPGNSTAEIWVHPNGKFLYVSNRGHNSIASFAIAADGKLTPIEHTPTQGNHPRYFGLDPAGQHLLVGNMMSNNIVVFRVDASTGKLTPTGQVVECFSPSCILFAP